MALMNFIEKQGRTWCVEPWTSVVVDTTTPVPRYEKSRTLSTLRLSEDETWTFREYIRGDPFHIEMGIIPSTYRIWVQFGSQDRIEVSSPSSLQEARNWLHYACFGLFNEPLDRRVWLWVVGVFTRIELGYAG
jgi:hypothetical protein